MRKAILLITTICLWFSIYIYNPYLTPELLSLKVSASVAGIIVGMRPFMQMGIRFPMGIISGKKGKHKSLVTMGTACAAVAAFLMYLWPNPVMITLGSCIAGFASATYVGYSILYGQYYPPGHTSEAMGVINTVEYIASFAAFLIGGTMFHGAGIRSIFLVAAIVAAVGTVVSLFVKEVPTPPSPENAADIRKLLKDKTLLVSCLLGILVWMAAYGTAYSFTSKLAQDMGASGFVLGLLNSLFIAASAVGSIFASSRTAIHMGHVQISVAGFIFLVIYAAVLPGTKNDVLFGALQVLGGFAFGALSSIFMSNSVRGMSASQKTSGMGVYQAAYSLGMGLGSVTVGLFADHLSLSAGFIAMAVVAFIGGLVTIYAGKRKLLAGPRK